MGLGVAVICFKYPPKYSGYGNQMKSVIEGINNKNEDIFFSILTGNFMGNRHKSLNNIKIYPLGSPLLFNISIKIGSLLYSLSLFIWLIINARKYSIIHCVGAHSITAIPSVIVGKLLRKKVLVKITQAEYRETLHNNSLKKAMRSIRKAIVKNTDYFISISSEITNELFNSGINRKKIIEIPNGVTTDRFHPINNNNKIILREKLNIPNEAVVILYTGALNKRKGIYDLLEAMRNLTVTGESKVVLVVCGPDHENVYENEILNKKYDIRIIYAGKVDNIEEYYQCSDIFVLPSYSEGLPNVMLEAAMCKSAIVATDIGGNRDIIENGITGLLFSPGNITQLKDCLNSIVYSPEKIELFSEKVYNSALSKYSMDLVSKKYLDQYLKMRSNNSKFKSPNKEFYE